ncbi:MAG: FAD-dependent oxidoreductase [Synergistaceae bacterium]|nr:FAD-dependent oxidoreductase [Synergistaceae bacterium]
MPEISRRSFLKGTAAGALSLAAMGMFKSAAGDAYAEDTQSVKWDLEADVVVIGAGGAGLPAALKAQADGASVLLVDANWDVGGHAAVSEGYLHNGAYMSVQQKHGVRDSADLYYFDHTRGVPNTTRYNDRSVVRSTANAMHESYEFFLAKGLVVQDRPPYKHDYYRALANANEPESVPRQTYADASQWENMYTGTAVCGIGVTRPLEKSLRDGGAKFLLNYHMDSIYREGGTTGKVLGVKASYTPHIMPGQSEPLKSFFTDGNIDMTQPSVNIRAKKGVIICTGGSTGNEAFRTMFDPRLGPEFDGLGGMPFSDQDGSGELAAMRIGAALGTMAAYANNSGGWITTPSRFGCRYGYGKGFSEYSKIWPLVRANGIKPDFDSLIIVNMLGQRCGNEDKYNTSKYVEDRFDFFDTALSSVFIDPKGDGNAECYGGPLWAIFDAGAAERNDWNMVQGIVDYEGGYAFKADTLEELAKAVINKYYENIHMNPETLVETVRRYNAAVDAGVDDDWGKKSLGYKIEKGPFYALWAVPSLHDTLAGIRIDKNYQVLDLDGKPIPGLFCAGESSGAMRIHGLGRCMTGGYIAGRAAASVDENGLATASTALDPKFAGMETNDLTVIRNRYDVTFMPGSEAAAKAAADSAVGAAESKAGDTYVGTSDNGMGGPVQVQISVNDKKITDIKILKQSETPGIGDVAFEPLIKSALEKQSPNLDAVSGATITTKAFCEALTKAMVKAGLIAQ